MLRFHAFAYIHMMEHLSHLEELGGGMATPELHERYKVTLASALREFEGYLSDLHLSMSIVKLKKIIAMTSEPTGGFREAISQLKERIQDELVGRTFFYVQAAMAELYEEKAPFGEAVASRLPEAIEDSEEAGKCLALGRYTAAVFHLMRVMEVGVRAVAKKLNVVVDPKDTWGQIVAKISNALNSLPTSTQRKRDKKESFQALAAHLHSVKEAWRNPTMHPKATYTEEEAEEIYRLVKAFMRHLAEYILAKR